MASSSVQQQAEALSQAVFTEMVDDLLYGLCCEELRHALERKLPCPHCGRNCRDLFVGQYVVPCSRQPSQQTMPLSLMPGGVTENTTSLECIQCKRSIASPRYAQHLSECMGLTGRKRRPALSRTLASGNRASPYLTGDSDEDDEDSAVAIKKRKRIKGSSLRKETSAYSPSPLAQSPTTQPTASQRMTSSLSASQLPTFQKQQQSGLVARQPIALSDASSG